MNSSKTEDTDKVYESFIKLVQVIREDREIEARVKQMLQMNLYQRRSVLNNWLEELRVRDAPENLLSALSCLFNDKLAEKVLTLINEVEIKDRQ